MSLEPREDEFKPRAYGDGVAEAEQKLRGLTRVTVPRSGLEYVSVVGAAKTIYGSSAAVKRLEARVKTKCGRMPGKGKRLVPCVKLQDAVAVAAALKRRRVAD